MQQPVDPIVIGLIFALLIAIVVIIIIGIKYFIKTRKPYQFTEDITDLSKIFTITPLKRQVQPIITSQAPELSEMQYPAKEKSGEQ